MVVVVVIIRIIILASARPCARLRDAGFLLCLDKIILSYLPFRHQREVGVLKQPSAGFYLIETTLHFFFLDISIKHKKMEHHDELQ